MQQYLHNKKMRSRQRRRMHIRRGLAGTAQRPRLAVFRSLKHIYAQIIDDTTGRTLVAMSDQAKDFDKSLAGKKTQTAMAVGKQLAVKALAAGVKQVAFDRSGYLYHGRVKALADGARSAGLEF